MSLWLLWHSTVFPSSNGLDLILGFYPLQSWLLLTRPQQNRNIWHCRRAFCIVLCWLHSCKSMFTPLSLVDLLHFGFGCTFNPPCISTFSVTVPIFRISWTGLHLAFLFNCSCLIKKKKKKTSSQTSLCLHGPSLDPVSCVCIVNVTGGTHPEDWPTWEKKNTLTRLLDYDSRGSAAGIFPAVTVLGCDRECAAVCKDVPRLVKIHSSLF